MARHGMGGNKRLYRSIGALNVEDVRRNPVSLCVKAPVSEITKPHSERVSV